MLDIPPPPQPLTHFGMLSALVLSAIGVVAIVLIVLKRRARSRQQ